MVMMSFIPMLPGLYHDDHQQDVARAAAPAGWMRVRQT
jgi:hypothetical protein